MCVEANSVIKYTFYILVLQAASLLTLSTNPLTLSLARSFTYQINKLSTMVDKEKKKEEVDDTALYHVSLSFNLVYHFVFLLNIYRERDTFATWVYISNNLTLKFNPIYLAISILNPTQLFNTTN